MSRGRPERLRVTIGGYAGPSYALEPEGDALVYRVYGYGFEPATARELHPTARAWETFAGRLEAIGVWDWGAEYVDPVVLDGTQWSLQIAWGGRAVASEGSNAFPSGFEALLAAVRELLGGLEFR